MTDSAASKLVEVVTEGPLAGGHPGFARENYGNRNKGYRKCAS